MLSKQLETKGIKSSFSPETIGCIMALKALAKEFDTIVVGRGANGRLYLNISVLNCDLDIAISTEEVACITGTLLGKDIDPIVVPPCQIQDEVVALFART